MKTNIYRLFIFILVLTACGTNNKEKSHLLILSAQQKINDLNQDGALKDLNKCEKIDKDNPMIYYLRGNILMNKRLLNDAIVEYDKAIELNNDFMEAYINRGKAWFYLGDKEKKCKDYLKAESLGAKNLYEDTKFCK